MKSVEELFGCNNSSSHWIKIVGLSQCNDFLHFIFFLHISVFENSSGSTDELQDKVFFEPQEQLQYGKTMRNLLVFINYN